MEEAMKELLAYLSKVYPLSEACQEYLKTIVKFKKFKKGDFLLRAGTINRDLYFILKGKVYCYYHVGDDEVPDWFFGEGDAVASVGSFYDQTPSEDFIKAKTDVEAAFVTRELFDHLCRNYPDFSYLANLLFIKYLKEFHFYARVMRKHSAKERYEKILEKMRGLFDWVPDKLIAAWLGVAKETISRARSRNRKPKK
jgi:CRP-like cAMP-binding protein